MPAFTRLAATGIVATLAAAVASPGHAQDYPSRPIRVIVPYSAGGGADNAARVIAQRLGTALHTQVVIDNRPGASGMIGAQAVAQATPDGYTVLYDASTYAVNPALRKMPFDPDKDLVPVSLAVTVPNILVVHPDAPYKSFKEFVDYARQHPGKVSYASYGAGSPAHLVGELLKNQAGIDMLHVPYTGIPPAVMDVAAGRISSVFASYSDLLPHVQAGTLRILASTGSTRSPISPDIPTMKESGYGGFEVVGFGGLLVPAGTPAALTAKMAASVQKVLARPEIRSRLLELGFEPVDSNQQAFGALVREQNAFWAKVIQDAHVKVE